MESRAHHDRVYSPRGRTDLDLILKKCTLPMNGNASNMALRALPKGRAPHVCIVGAGFAGLRCADVLSQRGLKVTILEGRDRIGGRVHQFSQSDHVYDLGPNWIHGTDHNPILELAMEMKDVTFSTPDMPPSLFDQSGHLMDPGVAKEHYDVMWGIIAGAFKYSKEHCASIPSTESLMDHFRTKVQEMQMDQVSSNLVLAMARSWGDFVGEPIEKQSLKFFWLEECIEGENLYLASTYKGILSKIGKAALAKAELHLSTKVTSIASGVTKGQESSVAVTTVFGQVLNFDEVIVTCPLGWLKRNVSSFLPPLPSQIIKAINDISYGRLEKVYLTFPTAFWHQGDSGGTSRPFFSNFLSPTYTDQNPKHWTVECALLDSLPHSCAHPTLLFYVHGPCAQHVTSLIDGLDTNSKQHYQRLNDFFGPYYSRLPNFSSSSSDCKPTAIIATNWQNDEFSGWGSYTTFQTSRTSDNVQLDQDIEALREGCPEQRVWFAGEHTAPFVALGTTTGAYWSGQAVAQRLAEGYGM